VETIFINSPRAQEESEALLRSLELSVLLLSAIRKDGLTIYQYRPTVTFIKAEDNKSAQVKFSYAYKYQNINAGVYPEFTSIQIDNEAGIDNGIETVIHQIKSKSVLRD
jgi:hypothetical protein